MNAYLVTGAGGFVGGAAARSLAADGVPVIATDLVAPSLEGAHATGGDLAAPSTLESIDALGVDLSGVTVIHAAALMSTTETEPLWRANVEATRLLLEWSKARGARRFVFLSSGGVYGYAGRHRHEEDGPLAPVGFYGHTKLIGEQMARAYAEVSGFESVSLRLFFPFGPGQQRGVFSFIERAVREGVGLTINPGGAPRMNPIHIHDLVALIRRVCADDTPPGVYNAAGPDEVSFLDAVRLFERAHGKEAVIAGEGDAAVTDMMGSMERARRDLGWAPSRGASSIVPSYLGVSPAGGGH